MEVKLLQFIRDAPKKLLKMIYDERFVDNLLKIMLVHFMTRDDRSKVFHDLLEWQYFCEIGVLSTLLCDRSLKVANSKLGLLTDHTLEVLHPADTTFITKACPF